MDALATENVWWKISISIYYKTGPVNIPWKKIIVLLLLNYMKSLFSMVKSLLSMLESIFSVLFRGEIPWEASDDEGQMSHKSGTTEKPLQVSWAVSCDDPMATCVEKWDVYLRCDQKWPEMTREMIFRFLWPWGYWRLKDIERENA